MSPLAVLLWYAGDVTVTEGLAVERCSTCPPMSSYQQSSSQLKDTLLTIFAFENMVTKQQTQKA
jgi:hypothetical protein